jgi:hypothetical protein
MPLHAYPKQYNISKVKSVHLALLRRLSITSTSRDALHIQPVADPQVMTRERLLQGQNVNFWHVFQNSAGSWHTVEVTHIWH